ncbi:helix-turn-helix domain-containing protein [Flectobacillus sp. DC10W]|uniref:Helix-turn-helix domain-containing protein n=1 Tax=Flectobacillus longus TaxID=2984207 RepID=A0ABT6YH95_9BACT|nr:helix-turn-helix domain-containing protein [Flectobacillus longus]MDI9862971.1 helix-turn-helix domain-containing protein [Flectobacillus longus]
MVLLEFPPSPILKEFVRTFRIVDFVFSANQIIPYKPYPPKPEHCLSFYPRDTETVEYAVSGKTKAKLKSVVFGQQTEVTHRYVGRDFLVFQVVFRPGALFRLTGIPSFELKNSYIDAETIFPLSIKDVNLKLQETKNYTDMVNIVESFLISLLSRKAKPSHGLDIITNQILNQSAVVDIDWLAHESCLSTRQFERKFLERMGVSAKYYNSLIRFENAFRMKNKFPQLDWLTIAVQCGYYDYQHLSKTYQKLTLKSPTEFHLLDLNSPERSFGQADTY